MHAHQFWWAWPLRFRRYYYFQKQRNFLFRPWTIEDCIRYHLIPTLTGQDGLNDLFRVILSLPTRLGGLGICDPLSQSADHYSDSTFILSPLIDTIIHKGDAPISLICSEVAENKKTVLRNHQCALCDQVSSLRNTITDPSLLRCLEAASERGASSWLSALPIREHGFTLHKGDFRDALCLRYGWIPPYLSSHCVCGHGLSIEHALNCKCGGFPSIRHNELRDITADLLTEVCHNVLVEPPLFLSTGNHFTIEPPLLRTMPGSILQCLASGLLTNALFWMCVSLTPLLLPITSHH